MKASLCHSNSSFPSAVLTASGSKSWKISSSQPLFKAPPATFFSCLIIEHKIQFQLQLNYYLIFFLM